MNKEYVEHCSLTCLVIDGEYKAAQFGLEHGDLEGHGYLALEFLKHFFRKDEFLKKLKSCRWATDEDIKKGIINCESAEILEAIQVNEPGLALINSLDFAGNSRFCKWVYVIDFDNNKFEIYKGLNKNPLTQQDRFFKFNTHELLEEEHHYPVKLHMSYDLNHLPLSF